MNLDQFSKMIPSNREAGEWFQIARDIFPKYGVNTIERIAGFMSQASHESADMRTLVENLNYSESGLLKTFPRYFTAASAKANARKPEQIANIVYNDNNPARVNKLGNTQPGDGWRFRGRGIFQLTGRFNYTAFGKTVNMTAEEAAVYLETKKGAFESALWYWNRNNLNRFADIKNIDGLSKAVNGGDIGLAERRQYFQRNLNVLATSSNSPTSFVELGIGSRGENVRKVQQALKLSTDGVFGPLTENAVRSWQRSNKYTVTGKVTETQFKKLTGGQ